MREARSSQIANDYGAGAEEADETDPKEQDDKEDEEGVHEEHVQHIAYRSGADSTSRDGTMVPTADTGSISHPIGQTRGAMVTTPASMKPTSAHTSRLRRLLPSRIWKRATTQETTILAKSTHAYSSHTPRYRFLPIISGLLQPFSILLQVPGLTEHCFVRLDDQLNPVAYAPNPILLDVGLYISLSCGVIANLALICRFMERKIYLSTLIAVLSLFVHDIINIIEVVSYFVLRREQDYYTLSTAFWLVCCSTITSMLTNSTLIYDWIRTPNFAKSGSGLTTKQRHLVIIEMILLVYLAFGALGFMFLLGHGQRISFINALYFTVVSIETIGFGDIRPTTLGSRIFLFFYAPLGILNLAVAVGAARDTLVEYWKAAYRRRRREALRKEKAREEQKSYGRKLDQVIRRARATSNHASPTAAIASPTASEAHGDLSIGADSEEFQHRLAKEERRENIMKAATVIALFAAFWLVGATLFSKAEGWTWMTGFYFCFVSFTTIGYGDVTPKTPAGRGFFILWALFGVATVTLLITVLTEAYSNRYRSVVSSTAKRRAAKLSLQSGGKSNEKHPKTSLRRTTPHQRQPVKEVKIGEEVTEKDLEMGHSQDLDEREGMRSKTETPGQILHTMKTFHAHFSVSSSASSRGHAVYRESELLSDLMEVLLDEEGLDELEKREVLEDEEGRRLLFWKGYERAVHNLITLTEELSAAMPEHDTRAGRLEYTFPGHPGTITSTEGRKSVAM